MLDGLRAVCQQELASAHSVLIASKNTWNFFFVAPTFFDPVTHFLIAAAAIPCLLNIECHGISDEQRVRFLRS